MTAILERLLDLLIGWVRHILPFYVMGDDMVGLVRRLGRYRRDLNPGLNWKWPLVEECLDATSALDSAPLAEQTVTTKDGHSVTLSPVLAYKVVNAKAYILDCATAESVLSDVGACVISEIVPTKTLTQVFEASTFDNACAVAMRKKAKKWGVYVESCGFADRVACRTYRLITSTKSVAGKP